MKDNKYTLEKKNKRFLSELKEYHVNKDTTLLNYLFEIFPNESRNSVKKILSSKCVLVNGLLVTQFDYKLYKKDVLNISRHPITNIEPVKRVANPPLLDIIYEDDEYLVINKPSGLLSIESDKEKINTAYSECLKYLQSKDKHLRCFQVHRLDKNTSGVLLFVKDEKLKELLIKNWNTLVKLREYKAIIDGHLDKKEDTIIKYLAKDVNNLMYDTHNPKLGEKSITTYKVIKENKNYTLVNVLIDTGKKNQIRVTFNDLSHPIIGDDKYGEATNPINRLGLHASKLKIKHPIKGTYLTFTAKTPKEFEQLMNK